MKSYDHKKIEKKWQETWTKTKLYETPDQVQGKDNYYLLTEFSYPSGNLHVGHWYAYSVPDILARYMRMKGRNVLYPTGFDAFGLPAENAAIKNKLNPRVWTEQNMAYMREQIRSMGTSFDWSREIATCDPKYYKWTQWLFLQLFKKGLAYRKQTMVNWCPNDKTVLANEQVTDGKCERCGAEVIQKEMLQWNIKITDYADRLIDDLVPLEWPEQIKESQRNWIGRSEGAEIDFPLDIGGKKYKFVILHGFKSAPDRPRWLWAKEQLEALGHEVILPRLPNPDRPKEEEQVAAALSATTYDENTVLVGHSLGTVVALKVLEKLDTPIARLVTVGGFVNKNFKDNPRAFEKTFTWSFDGEKIRRNAKSITILHDPRDHAVTSEQAKELSDLLQTPITLGTSTEPHFTGDKEPEVLMWLRPTIRVFTTRADTLFGATYLVLAPEHPWVTLALGHKSVLKNNEEVAEYVEETKKKSELERIAEQKDKTGVRLEGVEAINPATGEKIPLYVADYVLANYGTGAIMAVPAHDERDYEFARKFALPIKQVVMPVFGAQDKKPDAVHRETVNAVVRNEKGKLLFLKWKEYKWVTNIIGGIEKGETAEEAAAREVLEEAGYSAKALFVSPIAIESHFYAEHKKEWRSRIDHPVLMELDRDQKGPVSEEERSQHDTFWMSFEEAGREGLFKNNMLALDLALGKIGAYTRPRYGEEQRMVNSGEHDGLSIEEAKTAITEKFGRKKVTYKLRDWIVSRQRYWGVPIPIVHCETCGSVPVPDEELPVLLPEVEDYLPEGSGKSPLAKVSSFVNVTCPKCGAPAERETDTFDTFVDSSWYFLRYSDPHNSSAFASPQRMADWMPIDLYSGGAEHTTMHLLYSRFWHKALFDLGLVTDPEPYVRRMNRSIILGPDGQKMSKSRGNVIDPDEVVGRLGADTVRMYLAFVGPYNEVASYPWNPDGVVGVRRFLERVWRAAELVVPASDIDDAKYASVDRMLHRAIKKVEEDIQALKFNTGISQLMILLNTIEKEKQLGAEQFAAFLKMIAPFAPHIAEELWHDLGNDSSIHLEAWPAYDESLMREDEVTIAIQIDGKARGDVRIPADADKDATEKAAREAVASRLEGKKIIRTVVVPARLVNFVLEK
jgi:leucyl-tRNA synthetase